MMVQHVIDCLSRDAAPPWLESADPAVSFTFAGEEKAHSETRIWLPLPGTRHERFAVHIVPSEVTPILLCLDMLREFGLVINTRYSPNFKHIVRVRCWFRDLFSRAVPILSGTHERNRADKKRVPTVHAEVRDPFITVPTCCVSTETRLRETEGGNYPQAENVAFLMFADAWLRPRSTTVPSCLQPVLIHRMFLHDVESKPSICKVKRILCSSDNTSASGKSGVVSTSTVARRSGSSIETVKAQQQDEIALVIEIRVTTKTQTFSTEAQQQPS